MNPLASTANRIDAIVARQRTSRARDLVFAAVLALGIVLWGGALRSAVTHANAPVATAPASPAPLS